MDIKLQQRRKAAKFTDIENLKCVEIRALTGKTVYLTTYSMVKIPINEQAIGESDI